LAATEIKKRRPRLDILSLCLSLLKQALQLVKRMGVWLLDKGDKFMNAAVDSAGKAVGPTIIVSATVAQLTGQLQAAIDYIVKLLGQ
jgi:hypothetical protein